MDATRSRLSLLSHYVVWLLTAGCWLVLFATPASAANYRSRNFIIQCPDARLAKSVANAAEKYRHDLSVHWLGKALPAWPNPCPIRVVSGNYPAQGETTYNLRPVRDFQMKVIGTPKRILDSVLPHEITHTILASHFGRPLPRWADEGICTTVEHVSERSKHEQKLREFLSSHRGIAMNHLFLMREYPNDVLPMYAQGYSVCRFLIEQKSPREFVDFLSDYMRRPSWTENVRKHYGYESLAELQDYWLRWVKSGSGPVMQFAKVDRSPRGPGGGVRQASLTLNSPSNQSVALASNRSQTKQSWMPLETTNEATHSDSKPRQHAGSQELAHADGRPVGGALSESVNAGWYSRQRQHAATLAANQSRMTPSGSTWPSQVVSPIAPPSVRDSGHYSAGQSGHQRRMMGSNLPDYQIIDGQRVRQLR